MGAKRHEGEQPAKQSLAGIPDERHAAPADGRLFGVTRGRVPGKTGAEFTAQAGIKPASRERPCSVLLAQYSRCGWRHFLLPPDIKSKHKPARSLLETVPRGFVLFCFTEQNANRGRAFCVLYYMAAENGGCCFSRPRLSKKLKSVRLCGAPQRSAASHSAGLKPTSTKPSPTRMGRLTSMPSVASRASCSSSVMVGSFSFRPSAL